MKVLHYDLYQNQKVGMSNVVMSVENALIIAFLTRREKIIFYGNELLFNSQNKRIQDLYSILFDVEFKQAFEKPIVDTLPTNFYDTVFYYENEPNADFINKRKSCIDLKKWENVEEFSTLNNETLAYYSYLFYLEQERIPLVKKLKETFFPKIEYQQKAQEIVHSINKLYSGFNSVHVRRGDYLLTGSENKNIKSKDFLPILESHFEDNKLLVVHTDEEDLTYFDDIKKKYSNIWFIDLAILGYDVAEKGLISLLVASHSDKFIGTMKSTFTGLIQRYRIYNEKLEDFIYLYSQINNVHLEKGMFKKESFSQYPWNYSYLTNEFKQIAFWIREYESCYPQKRYPVQALRMYPNFITIEESSYIITKAKSNTSEYFERETRNRFILDKNDPIAKEIMERSCKILGYDLEKIESSIQVFTQYKEGQTFWHMDSLAPDYQGLRIASILFYLNEDFKGSKIEFPFLGVTWQPKKNTMLSYPLVNEFGEMNKLTSHSASIITEGTKYMCYFDIKEKNYL
jgi:hypothetical protein